MPELLRPADKTVSPDAALPMPWGLRTRLRNKGRGRGARCQGIAAREPNLTGDFAGAVYLPAPGFVPDPGGLAKAYAALFGRKGGRFLVGDARTLEQSGTRWRVSTDEGPVTAREAVVAMGPWSDQVFGPLGYSIPLAVKRGYHLHLRSRGNAVLSGPVLDTDQGIFAGADEPRHADHHRRRICQPGCAGFSSSGRAARRGHARCFRSEAIDANPWKGARPCLPDMLPVIGKAPRHPGLWFDFGHQHHG